MTAMFSKNLSMFNFKSGNKYFQLFFKTRRVIDFLTEVVCAYFLIDT